MPTPRKRSLLLIILFIMGSTGCNLIDTVDVDTGDIVSGDKVLGDSADRGQTGEQNTSEEVTDETSDSTAANSDATASGPGSPGSAPAGDAASTGSGNGNGSGNDDATSDSDIETGTGSEPPASGSGSTSGSPNHYGRVLDSHLDHAIQHYFPGELLTASSLSPYFTYGLNLNLNNPHKQNPIPKIVQAWRGLMEGTITPQRFQELTRLDHDGETEALQVTLQRWVCGGDCFSNGYVTRPINGYIVDLLDPATQQALADFEFDNVVIKGAGRGGYLLDATKGHTAWDVRPFHEVEGGWKVIVRKRGSVDKARLRQYGDWYVIGRAFLATTNQLLIVRNDEPAPFIGGGFGGKGSPIGMPDAKNVPELILLYRSADNVREDVKGLKYVPTSYADRIVDGYRYSWSGTDVHYRIDKNGDLVMDGQPAPPGWNPIRTDFRGFYSFSDIMDGYRLAGTPQVWTLMSMYYVGSVHGYRGSTGYICTPVGTLLGSHAGSYILLRDPYFNQGEDQEVNTDADKWHYHSDDMKTCRRYPPHDG